MLSKLSLPTLWKNTFNVCLETVNSSQTVQKTFFLDQIDHPFLREQSPSTEEEMGVTTYVDIGPKKAL